jgi:hypothetical protein
METSCVVGALRIIWHRDSPFWSDSLVLTPLVAVLRTAALAPNTAERLGSVTIPTSVASEVLRVHISEGAAKEQYYSHARIHTRSNFNTQHQ